MIIGNQANNSETLGHHRYLMKLKDSKFFTGSAMTDVSMIPA